MSDDRKLKILLFGKMDGKNKRGHPHREWTDDIVEWCGENLTGTEPLSTGPKELA